VTAILLDRAAAQSSDPPPLQLESKIALGAVRGRIDHLAVDLSRRRLFVAELGNNTVGVIDLNERKGLHVITGLKEPQGVGYVPSSDALFVANAGDGSVQVFRGANYEAAGRIELGGDADNIRVDPESNHVFVGYGDGALAEIDPATNRKLGDIPLQGHPESFQLARSAGRIFVNVPRSRVIAAIDRSAANKVASWRLDTSSNFPMTLDEEAGRVLVASRNPAQFWAISMRDGKILATAATCGDSDDLFLDAKRHRVYVVCGDGHVDVFESQGDTYRRSSRMQTISGARTGLFVPELDRLFVAARATSSETAAILVFRPGP
jgi:DNA-binding beta-propeller fold protein YncE